jgi:hypothetical protein
MTHRPPPPAASDGEISPPQDHPPEQTGRTSSASAGSKPEPTDGTGAKPAGAAVAPGAGQGASPESGPAAAGPDNPREALLRLALSDLSERRETLLCEIRDLEQRRDQIQRDLTTTFSGQSDAIARRLRGFQEYLVGALQDLAATADQIDLVTQPVVVQPSPLDQAASTEPAAEAPPTGAGGLFTADTELIQEQLQRFQGQPDFYAPPWKLRRTLEPSATALLENWFLGQGGRGAQPSSGSRHRNVVISGAAIAILGEIYGDRFQTLVLAGQPERLGEWRRGLQDCLGLNREDFGPNSGIVLFERAEALIERADRLEESGELPFIVVDAAEPAIAVPILQFPLWLAFAAGPGEFSLEEEF